MLKRWFTVLAVATLLVLPVLASVEEISTEGLYLDGETRVSRFCSPGVRFIGNRSFGSANALAYGSAASLGFRASGSGAYTQGIPGFSSRLVLQNMPSAENGGGGYQKRDRPPPRYAGEILGGIVGGVLGGAVGGAAGFLVLKTIDPDVDDRGPGDPAVLGLIIGIPAGYLLGSVIGVYAVGDTPSETGNFLATLCGGVALLPGAPIGATVGFNLTRRYKSLAEIGRAPVERTKTLETDTVTPSQRIPPLTTRPAFDVKRAAGETITGMGAGLLAGGLGAAVFGFLGDESDGYDQDRGATGFLVGCTLGSAMGVYFSGNSPSETGNLMVTLGCSVLAALVSQATGTEGRSLVLCPVGATIGFNVTRRYRSLPPPSQNGLINIKEGRVCIGVPSAGLRFDSRENRVLLENINLLGATF